MSPTRHAVLFALVAGYPRRGGEIARELWPDLPTARAYGVAAARLTQLRRALLVKRHAGQTGWSITPAGVAALEENR